MIQPAGSAPASARRQDGSSRPLSQVHDGMADDVAEHDDEQRRDGEDEHEHSGSSHIDGVPDAPVRPPAGR